MLKIPLTDIVRKAILTISAVAALGMNGCEHKTRQVYDFDRNGTMDTITTWYAENGNKAKEKIVLGREKGDSNTITWYDTYDTIGTHKKERVFDNESDGKPEGRFTYDPITGILTGMQYFTPGGKPIRAVPKDSSKKAI
jgi:hypothetical protein